MNYQRLATTASRLLAKHGRNITLRRTSAGTYDPATGTASSTTSDQTLKGALFDFGKGVTTVRGTLVEAGDKELYVEARTGVVPATRDTVIVGADTYSVVSVGEINPAGTPVVYSAHLRR